MMNDSQVNQPNYLSMVIDKVNKFFFFLFLFFLLNIPVKEQNSYQEKEMDRKPVKILITQKKRKKPAKINNYQGTIADGDES